MSVIIGQQK